MDLPTTKATLLKWVTSCETYEQIDLFHQSVQAFIVERFKGQPGVEEAAHELRTAAITQETRNIMKSGLWDTKPIGKKLIRSQLN